MSFQSVRLPKELLDEIKIQADKDFRTVPQQIQYWIELGKQQEFRKWQLQKMMEGVEDAQNGRVRSHKEVMALLNRA
ncbi:MAG: hypothetical protein LBQ34_00240 [Alphaproteobacteria bacterium]|jgi:predicted transcriptional regulator|nr:hypothetical protein [Alphaproteobacteria bacterium]